MPLSTINLDEARSARKPRDHLAHERRAVRCIFNSQFHSGRKFAIGSRFGKRERRLYATTSGARGSRAKKIARAGLTRGALTPSWCYRDNEETRASTRRR